MPSAFSHQELGTEQVLLTTDVDRMKRKDLQENASDLLKVSNLTNSGISLNCKASFVSKPIADRNSEDEAAI